MGKAIALLLLMADDAFFRDVLDGDVKDIGKFKVQIKRRGLVREYYKASNYSGMRFSIKTTSYDGHAKTNNISIICNHMIVK